MSFSDLPSYRSWHALSHIQWSAPIAAKAGQGAVYVDLFHENIDYLLKSLQIARLIGLETGLPVVGLTGSIGIIESACPNLNPDEIRHLAQAFGVDVLTLDHRAPLAPLVGWLAAETTRLGVALECLKDAELRDFLRKATATDGFPLGRYIYDTHLRKRLVETLVSLDTALLEDASGVMAFHEDLKAQFERAPPVWLVCGHIDYSPFGVMAETALRQGGQVAFFRNEGLTRIHLIHGAPHGGQTLMGRIRETNSAAQRAMLEAMISEQPEIVAAHFRAVATGKLFRSARFVDAPLTALPPQKNALLSSLLREELSLPQDKPIVGLFSITFSDIAQSDDQLFDDNYCWLRDTLEFAATRTDVSWVVKIHPYDAAYNVTGAMGGLQRRFEVFDHIRFVGHGWTPLQTFIVSDVVSTVRGSPGLQGAMLGKPVVFAGRGHFSDFGFGEVPATKADYFETLIARAWDGASDGTRSTALAQAYQYAEDTVLGIPTSLLPAFGALSADPAPWDTLLARLAWYSPEQDPLSRALWRAMRDGLSRVGADGAEYPRGAGMPSHCDFPLRAGLAHFWPSALVPVCGFYPVENWGVWLAAKPAAVLLNCRSPMDGILRLRLRVIRHQGADQPRPALSLDADGLQCRMVEDTETDMVFETGPATFGTDGQILLVFTPSGGRAPSEVSDNPDTRVLSVGIQEIAIDFLSPPQDEQMLEEPTPKEPTLEEPKAATGQEAEAQPQEKPDTPTPVSAMEP